MKTITTFTNRPFVIVFIGALLLTCSAQVVAQDIYYPEGTYWEEEYYLEDIQDNDTTSQSMYVRSTVMGDTVINGLTYNKVEREIRVYEDFEKFEDSWWDHVSPWRWLAGVVPPYYIRQEGNKIYNYSYGGWVFPYYNDCYERMAMDFDWEEGATIPYDFHNTLTIGNISQIVLADGNTYDCIMGRGECLQIRGIGNVGEWHMLLGGTLSYRWATAHQYARVLKFVRDDVTIYEWDPDQILGIKDISSSEASSQATYTLTGAKMPAKASLQPGIYIKGGKKFVVK